MLTETPQFEQKIEKKESRNNIKEAIIKGSRVALVSLLIGSSMAHGMSKPKESIAYQKQKIELISL